MDWCLDEAKEIRIETLTAKILCKRHNTALSELDSTAGLAFNSIQDYVATTNQRQDMPHLNWAPKQFTIYGPKLERWCLKTLQNFSFNRQLIVGQVLISRGRFQTTSLELLLVLRSSLMAGAFTQHSVKMKRSISSTASAIQRRLKARTSPWEISVYMDFASI